MSVLWMLIILTVLSVSLGRQTHIESALVKYAVGKVKSKYLARAGLVYAMEQIRLDSQDSASSTQDTLYRCAVRLAEGQSPQDMFKQRSLAGGYFDVAYVPAGQENTIYYGFQDEERRININALSVGDAAIFSALIVALGFDEMTAETIAYAVLDWKDEDDAPVDAAYGAENDYYQHLPKPYRCKNRPLDTPQELLLVRGMTPEIYRAVADYVTVYPKQGFLRINFDTAPPLVLTALARAKQKMLGDVPTGDAQALVEKIIDYRDGEDDAEFTADDRVVAMNEIPLNAPERNLFLAMSAHRQQASDYLRIRARGVEQGYGATSWVEAVVFRSDLSVLSWHRN